MENERKKEIVEMCGYWTEAGEVVNCPDCKRGTILRGRRCDNCGLSWEEAALKFESEIRGERSR